LRRAVDRAGRRGARRLARYRLPAMDLRPGLAPLRPGGGPGDGVEGSQFRETLRAIRRTGGKGPTEEGAMSVDANKIKAIFLAASEKTTPAERAAYLD